MLVSTYSSSWSTLVLLTPWRGPGKGFRILSSAEGLLEVYDAWASGVDPDGICVYGATDWLFPKGFARVDEAFRKKT